MARRAPWTVRDSQTVYDLAIQLYGDFDALDKIIFQTKTLDDPTTGTLLETENTTDLLALNLFSRNIVATSQPPQDAPVGGIGFMIIGSTFIPG